MPDGLSVAPLFLRPDGVVKDVMLLLPSMLAPATAVQPAR